MPFEKHILVYAEDAAVRRTKELILENAGFNVIAVGTFREVEYVASRSIFDLVILGRTVAAENKRLAAQTVKRKQPNTSILEICDFKQCVDNPDYVLHNSNPEELMEMVKSILHVRGNQAQI
jgi:DNA-binding response OmpR family regulator